MIVIPPPFIFQDFFQCVQEFLKLEKIEFGGLQGKCLGDLVQQMFADFQELMNKLTNKSYDPLAPANKVHVLVHVSDFKKTDYLQLQNNDLHCRNLQLTTLHSKIV